MLSKFILTDKGFSLFELIIVLAIMAVLLGTLTFTVSFEEDAKFKRALTETYLISKAASQYFKSHLYDENTFLGASEFLQASQEEKYQMLVESGNLPSSFKEIPMNPWGFPYEIINPTRSQIKNSNIALFGLVRSQIPDVFKEQFQSELLQVRKDAPSIEDSQSLEEASNGYNYLIGLYFAFYGTLQEASAKIDQMYIYQDRGNDVGSADPTEQELYVTAVEPWWENVLASSFENDSNNWIMSQTYRLTVQNQLLQDRSGVVVEEFGEPSFSADSGRRQIEIDPEAAEYRASFPSSPYTSDVVDFQREAFSHGEAVRHSVIFPNR